MPAQSCRAVRTGTGPRPIGLGDRGLPPWEGATARTIARPRPLPDARRCRPGRRRERSGRRPARAAGGMPGPSSATSTTASRPAARGELDPRARRRVADGVVEQVEDQPVSSSGLPSTAAAGRSRSAARVRRPSARPRPRRCRRPPRGRSAVRAPGRPASARASSSRSATRRLIRFEERSAESTIAALLLVRGRSSEAWSSSRLARMLVSGVRSSCEASATNSRCFRIVCSLSERAASSERSISLQGPGELTDLVVGLRLGHAPGGVAGGG